MKFHIDEYVCDVLIEVGCGAANIIPDALRSGFRQIYRIEPSAVRYAAVYDAVRLELERSPCSTKVMLYGGPVIVALNQACENSQNKPTTIHLKSSCEDDQSDVAPDNDLRLLEEIRTVRQWYVDNIVPPVVIVSGILAADSPVLFVQLVNELQNLCDRYYFQILDDGLQRNVLVAMPSVWFQAYAGAVTPRVLNNQNGKNHCG